MKGKELANALLADLRSLLLSRDRCANQIIEAEKNIVIGQKQVEESNLQPISIENDAVWYNYLLDMLRGVVKDITIVVASLEQLGVSFANFVVSDSRVDEILNRCKRKSQGESALDFSVAREK